MSKVKIIDHVIENKNHYLRMLTDDDQIPFITTQTVRVMPNLTNNLTFYITASSEPNLFKTLCAYDSQVKVLLQDLSESVLRKCNARFQQRHRQKIVDKKSTFLAPSYMIHKSINELCCSVRSNKLTSMHFWDGAPIESYNQLGAGDYQFVIRCDYMTMLKSKETDALSKIQLRAYALRYKPLHQCSIINPHQSYVPVWSFISDEPANCENLLKSNAASSEKCSLTSTTAEKTLSESLNLTNSSTNLEGSTIKQVQSKNSSIKTHICKDHVQGPSTHISKRKQKLPKTLTCLKREYDCNL